MRKNFVVILLFVAFAFSGCQEAQPPAQILSQSVFSHPPCEIENSIKSDLIFLDTGDCKVESVSFEQCIPKDCAITDFCFCKRNVWVSWFCENYSSQGCIDYDIDTKQIKGSISPNNPLKSELNYFNRETGTVTYQNKEIQLPEYNASMPAEISLNQKIAIYAVNNKKSLIAYDLQRQQELFRFENIIVPDYKQTFLCLSIQFLGDRYAVLNLLNEQHQGGVFVINTQTGEGQAFFSGGYTVKTAGADTLALRPAMFSEIDSEKNPWLLIIKTKNGKIITETIDKILDLTEKSSICFSDNGLFAVTCKQESKNTIFSIYRTKDDSLKNRIKIEHANSTFDPMQNGDIQAISDDGKSILIVDTSSNLYLINSYHKTGKS